MTNQERKDLCQLLASLFSPPDLEMVRQIHLGTLYSYFQRYMRSWGGEIDLLKGFIIEGEGEGDPGILLNDLEEAYERLFSGLGSEGISLVESSYKLWTQDSHCPLPFASEKGLLMGDSALHLSEVYRQCGLEVAEEFKGCPDHIVMELEFLSYLYQWATDIEVKKFIEDHLDWIPFLEEEFERFCAHPFYRSLSRVLSLFLNEERKRLEM